MLQCSLVDGRGPCVVDSFRALPHGLLVAAAMNASQVRHFALYAHELLHQLWQIAKMVAILLDQTGGALPAMIP